MIRSLIRKLTSFFDLQVIQNHIMALIHCFCYMIYKNCIETSRVACIIFCVTKPLKRRSLELSSRHQVAYHRLYTLQYPSLDEWLWSMNVRPRENGTQDRNTFDFLTFLRDVYFDRWPWCHYGCQCLESRRGDDWMLTWNWRCCDRSKQNHQCDKRFVKKHVDRVWKKSNSRMKVVTQAPRRICKGLEREVSAIFWCTAKPFNNVLAGLNAQVIKSHKADLRIRRSRQNGHLLWLFSH